MQASINLIGLKAQIEQDESGAMARLRQFISATFNLEIKEISFHQDATSLNSVRGFLTLPEHTEASLFFKFHTEEQEQNLGEHYRAGLLKEAGMPVDVPLYASTEAGAALLIYQRRSWPRYFDLCRSAEQAGCPENLTAPLIAAQRTLDEQNLHIILQHMHKTDAPTLRHEPILQLFLWRLLDDADETRPGGRVQRFYEKARFEFPGLETALDFKTLSNLHWVINGVPYAHSLAEILAVARKNLSPASLAAQPASISHGDAHNANLWFTENAQQPLTYYDPAFAGAHVPVLLGEVKPLFHNIFAHPEWLYHPESAAKNLEIKAKLQDQTLLVEHNWALTPLRQEFLNIKRDLFFAPLLRACAAQNALPANWQEMLRSALFCCPFLVMNLTPHAGQHNAKTGLLGFAISVIMGSQPQASAMQDMPSDPLAEFFAQLQNLL